MPTHADTMQAVADRNAVIDVLSSYATGLDARDWVLWRSVFTDEVLFDLSSWSGEAPRQLSADRVVRTQARIFAELIVTQHFIANHRVTLDADHARCLAHMRAEHWLDTGNEVLRYTMFGYYDDRLTRTPPGWKINAMQLNVTHTEGDRKVMDEAVRRARAAREGNRSGDRP